MLCLYSSTQQRETGQQRLPRSWAPGPIPHPPPVAHCVPCHALALPLQDCLNDALSSVAAGRVTSLVSAVQYAEPRAPVCVSGNISSLVRCGGDAAPPGWPSLPNGHLLALHGTRPAPERPGLAFRQVQARPPGLPEQPTLRSDAYLLRAPQVMNKFQEASFALPKFMLDMAGDAAGNHTNHTMRCD